MTKEEAINRRLAEATKPPEICVCGHRSHNGRCNDLMGECYCRTYSRRSHHPPKWTEDIELLLRAVPLLRRSVKKLNPEMHLVTEVEELLAALDTRERT